MRAIARSGVEKEAIARSGRRSVEVPISTCHLTLYFLCTEYLYTIKNISGALPYDDTTPVEQSLYRSASRFTLVDICLVLCFESENANLIKA